MNIDTFETFERTFGYRYPPEFFGAFSELTAQLNTTGFRKAFPQGRLCRYSDVLAARSNNVPPNLIPFLLEFHEKFTDYYCFDRGSSQSENAVVVYSGHAIVFRWDNFNEFIVWLRRRCEE